VAWCPIHAHAVCCPLLLAQVAAVAMEGIALLKALHDKG
jgi:hypothetical protein